MSVCACVWRPQVNIGMPFSIMLHRIFEVGFFTQSVAHINWLGELASRPRDLLASACPVLGSQHTPPHWVFIWGLGVQTQVPKIVWQILYPLSPFPILLVPAESHWSCDRTKNVGWKAEPSVGNLGPRPFQGLSTHIALLPASVPGLSPGCWMGWLVTPETPCSRIR